jgi:tetratricopeptide (TPR) repeat protein
MTGKLKAAAALFLIAVVMAASFGAYKHKQANTREALLEKAEAWAAEGSYADAVRNIDIALESADDGNCSDEALHLKKAQYLQEAGDTDQALSEAMRVVKNTQEGQPEYDEAWERIVSICTQEEEYGKLATLLEGSGVESVKSRYYNYLVYDPVFRDPPGTYEGSLELYIESQGVGAVFYTIDGTEPTEKSNLYNDPILLRPGIYTVKAFFINRYGLKSSTVTGTYQITNE